jgi:hypothetical protein
MKSDFVDFIFSNFYTVYIWHIYDKFDLIFLFLYNKVDATELYFVQFSSLIISDNLRHEMKIQCWHGFKIHHFILVLMLIQWLFGSTRVVCHPFVVRFLFICLSGIYQDDTCSPSVIGRRVYIFKNIQIWIIYSCLFVRCSLLDTDNRIRENFFGC